MKLITAFLALLLATVSALAASDAVELLATFINTNGYACAEVTNVVDMGNDTYRVTCEPNTQYPSSQNYGTYVVSLAGGKITVTKIR